MTKKIKFLAALIILGFSSLIIIQGIYSKKEYVRQSQEFKKDLNRALEESIRKLNREKTDSILKLFEIDFKDTNVVRFEYDMSDSTGPKVRVVNPINGHNEVVLDYSGVVKKDTLTKDYLLNIVRKNSLGLADPDKKENMVYWHDPLVERIESYQDTLNLSELKLRSLLQKELADRFIFGSYQLLQLEGDSSYSDTLLSGLKSRLIAMEHIKTENKAMLVFEQPFLNIIQRSWIILGTSFLVLLMMIFGFFTLFKIIKRQRRLSQLKDDFMDNVTHELLTPISTLGIAIESLHKYNAIEDKEKAEKYLQMSEMELNRISDIVHNVLITSSQEKGEIELRWENQKIKEILLKLSNYHITRSQKPVDIQIDCKEEISFLLDKQHFTNVINNLLDNAIKYGPSDSVSIGLKVECIESKLMIYVKDNGPGISIKEQSRIFEKFHRAQQMGKKGLGIGLFYVKSILGQMNGEIELLESSDQGTTFKVTLYKKGHD